MINNNFLSQNNLILFINFSFCIVNCPITAITIFEVSKINFCKKNSVDCLSIP
jgi:hypothetical protein